MVSEPVTGRTAAQLLQVPLTRPDLVYPPNEGAALELHRRLRARWHPDQAAGDKAIFQHLEALFQARAQMLTLGIWPGPGQEDLLLTSGKTLRLTYLRREQLELGTRYLLPHYVAYLLDHRYQALYDNGVQAIKELRFASPTMAQEMRRFLPELVSEHPTALGPLVILKKAPNLVPLAAATGHLGGQLDPRHVAWVLTRLHNLACYLSWANLTHNDLSLESCFISPSQHSVVVLGGWWYSRPLRAPMQQLPARSYQLWQAIARPEVRAQKLATRWLDREGIRQLARELLGDPAGGTLLRRKDVPPAMARWVTTPPLTTATADYQAWELARAASFTEHRFTELALDPQDIYGG